MTIDLTRRAVAIAAGLAAVLACRSAWAVVVGGGGSRSADCVSVFDAPGANSPAAPKSPRSIDCIDGDGSCDADGTRNGRCIFDLKICVNSNALAECTPHYEELSAQAL